MQHTIRFLMGGLLLVASCLKAQQIEFVHEFNTNGDGNPEILFAYQNKLYIQAANNNGNALYTLDGNSMAVECITCAYTSNWSYYGHGELNGKVYLDINTSANESQLYVTDGTVTGTQLFKEIYPGHRSFAHDFVTYNGQLYFAATDSANGRELWISDGTPSGTYMFWDFRVASDNGNPHNLFLRNNRIYMIAESTSGSLLFCTDGTLQGSQQLTTHFGFSRLVDGVDSLPQMIVYSINDSLFKIDPSTNAVSLISNNRYFMDGGFTPYNNKLYFYSTSSQAGKELTVTDGTSAGTGIFFDSDVVSALMPATPVVFNNLLFFSANHAGAGYEPWVTDGNINNTYMFKELCSSNPPYSSRPFDYTFHNGKMYFGASDCTTSGQLFQTDGTVSGTQPVYYPQASIANTGVSSFFSFNGNLYFSGQYDTKGAELYRLNTPTAISDVDKPGIFVYPNPAQQQVNFAFEQQDYSLVTLEVIDITGRKTATVINQYLPSGSHTFSLNTGTLAPGNYFYTLRTNQQQTSGRFIIVR